MKKLEVNINKQNYIINEKQGLIVKNIKGKLFVYFTEFGDFE